MKLTKKSTLSSLYDTDIFAEHVLQELTPFSDEAYVLFLKGDLGAGKTTFTKALAKKLGVQDTVISPTFILQKKYKTKHSFFKELVHIDAYRFENPKEAKVLDLGNTLTNPNTLVVIEWPEKLGKTIKPHKTIQIKTKNETTKEVSIL